MAEGGVEKIGLPDGFLKYKLADGSKAIKELGLVDHKGAVKAVLDILTDPELGCISSYDEIDAVGHRVVHGAEKIQQERTHHRRGAPAGKGMLRPRSAP